MIPLIMIIGLSKMMFLLKKLYKNAMLTWRMAALVTKSLSLITSTIGPRAASSTISFPMQDISYPNTFSQNGKLVPPFPNPAAYWGGKCHQFPGKDCGYSGPKSGRNDASFDFLFYFSNRKLWKQMENLL